VWEFLSQNLRNKISVTDFFTRIWGIARDKHQFKIGTKSINNSIATCSIASIDISIATL